MLHKLPVNYNEPTTKTIENIDVLWFENNAILAGFEVEHTTTIYSGLLRMSDLLAMQPNIEIKLYIVAPDDREGKFSHEVVRPTFSAVQKPLHTVCRFLPYSALLEKLKETNGLLPFLKPAFLDTIAQLHTPTVDSGA